MEHERCHANLFNRPGGRDVPLKPEPLDQEGKMDSLQFT